ncbi:hypothetical protein [Prosthecobacter sp.]|uniref:hypothetical protein n=1 Tax=Prosthecobacter sp. TaxID=1965333 RepID=UPI00378384FC
MKASRCHTALAARMLAMLTATVLLVQCAMPPQQAWRYIQTNGLLPYLAATGHHASPPFSTGRGYSQRHAYQRQTPPSSSWSSNWSTRNRYRYGAPSPSGYAANSYFSAPSANSGGSRYVPRSRPSAPSGSHSPAVKMPVEEPGSTPHVANTPPPSSPAPKSTGSTAPAPSSESLPYGTPVPGRMNMVNSPFAGKTQLVDVSGMSAGQTVKCPYTGKLFKVPPTQQAAAHTEPRLESKVEASKHSDEPKGGEKKP